MAVDNMKSAIDDLREDLNTNQFRAVVAYTVVAVIILFNRFILNSQTSDAYENTDGIRWFLITLSIPILVVILGLVSNIEFENMKERFPGVLESFSLTAFLAVATAFLFTVTGTTVLMAVLVIILYPIIIIFVAVYAIAVRLS
ncbi:MAG: hypothetical protein IH840_11210 [Candidatus Heimdallarchaeota archaeon]|nr:hypothetical protein [Candidatus Heimdallarchaeota archaeon]